MMEAIHEVVGVKLIPPEWVKGKRRLPTSEPVAQVEPETVLFRCLGCSLELGFLLEKKRTMTLA